MKRVRMISMMILLVMVLTACAKAVETQSVSFDSGKAATDTNRAALEAPMAPSVVTSQESSAASGAMASEPVDENQMVIMNADLNIAVDDPSESMSAIQKMASRMGGFTVSSSLYKSQTSSGLEVPGAYVSIRIPAEKLNDALAEIKALTGDPEKYVLNETITGEDVTQAYTDLKSRLKNLEEAELELSKFYESATKTEDVLAIYNQKQQVSQQIEVLKGQIQYYEQASAKSLITIQLQAKETIAPITVAGWQPAGIARDAVQALLNALRGIANALIWIGLFILPIVVVIGLPLFFLIRWLVRKNRRASAQKRMTPPAPPAE